MALLPRQEHYFIISLFHPDDPEKELELFVVAFDVIIRPTSLDVIVVQCLLVYVRNVSHSSLCSARSASGGSCSCSIASTRIVHRLTVAQLGSWSRVRVALPATPKTRTTRTLLHGMRHLGVHLVECGAEIVAYRIHSHRVSHGMCRVAPDVLLFLVYAGVALDFVTFHMASPRKSRIYPNP